MGFLRYDNPVMSGISKIANCVLLSMLWLIGCLPVITVGASTCALYYTVEKNIKNDRGYVAASFWHAYKENFRQAAVIGTLLLAAQAVFLSDFWILEELENSGYLLGNARTLFQVFMGLVLLYGVWVFAMLARFTNTIRQIMKNSLILMIRHLGSSIVIALCLVFGGVIMWLIPVSVCLMPTVIFWLISVPIEKVFKLYKKDTIE